MRTYISAPDARSSFVDLTTSTCDEFQRAARHDRLLHSDPHCYTQYLQNTLINHIHVAVITVLQISLCSRLNIC